MRMLTVIMGMLTVKAVQELCWGVVLQCLQRAMLLRTNTGSMVHHAGPSHRAAACMHVHLHAAPQCFGQLPVLRAGQPFAAF
jgi:hypothetical protein